MFIFYDIIFLLFALIYFPYLCFKGKWHRGFAIRFGWFPKDFLKTLEQKENIWIHAVSVGEVLAVEALIQKMKDLAPKYRIVCSTVTPNGHRLACGKLKGSDMVIYAPLDFSWIVRKFINVIQPKIYISAETEIWPNLLTALHKKGIPIILINGRISDKAFKGYQKVSFLMRRVLGCVKVFCMQTHRDADRLIHLGADPHKVRIIGNLKFDNLNLGNSLELHDLGFHREDIIFIAGSTHPGEEDILLDMYQRLIAEFIDLRLMIAPRHIERTEEVIKLIETKGFQPVKFSQIRNSEIDSTTIVVVDTIGDLRHLYRIAKIVFIGKTFTVGGGQNMLEPASFGKTILVGPLTENFKDIVQIFLNQAAMIQVKSPSELLGELTNLLRDPQRLEGIGLSAKSVVEQYKGATQKTLDIIAELL